MAVFPGFGLELVDQIDNVEEAGAGAVTDACTGDSDSKMAFAGAGSADQHGIALAGQEAARCQVAICDCDTGLSFTQYGDDLFFCLTLPLHLEILP